MRRANPSQTASMVALLRALADVGISHIPDFHDPTARPMLPPAWTRRFARIEKRAQRGGRGAFLEAVRRRTDMLALRTLVIDAYLRDAVARGARQLVILGAGLDGRAYRIAELASVRVFEVDHPTTQAYKKSRDHALAQRRKRDIRRRRLRARRARGQTGGRRSSRRYAHRVDLGGRRNVPNRPCAAANAASDRPDVGNRLDVDRQLPHEAAGE